MEPPTLLFNLFMTSCHYSQTDEITTNRKKHTTCWTGLFCDLTKVFDSVSHELLFLKLEFYGVKGSILKWLKSYLHNRKQTVVLHFVSSPNLLSDWKIVRHGVPQSSVLGQLLFKVYIDNFPCNIKFLIIFFLQMILIFLFLPVIVMN